MIFKSLEHGNGLGCSGCAAKPWPSTAQGDPSTRGNPRCRGHRERRPVEHDRAGVAGHGLGGLAVLIGLDVITFRLPAFILVMTSARCAGVGGMPVSVRGKGPSAGRNGRRNRSSNYGRLPPAAREGASCFCHSATLASSCVVNFRRCASNLAAWIGASSANVRARCAATIRPFSGSVR